MPVRRSAVLFGTTLFVGVALGAAGTWLSMRPAVRAAPAEAILEAETEATERVAGVDLAASGTAIGGADELRAKIRASVAAALAEQRRGHDLEEFLDQLEATARRQGHVTAVEILTGLAAIDADSPDDPDRAAAFSRRMERLQRELGQMLPESDPASARVSALAVLGDIRAAPAGPARDALVRRALDAIIHLPETEQNEARAALDHATAIRGAPSKASPPAGAGLDGILAQLSVTPDGKDRRHLITRFIDTASALPLEEQEIRFRQLDAASAIVPR